jgi:ketosteroid isomerase-like protein
MIIVEQTDDPYWSLVFNKFPLAGHAIQATDDTASFALGDYALAKPSKNIWSTRWLVLQRPQQPWMSRLILSYFEGWNRRDADLTSSLFAEDAVYVEKPFVPALHGRAEIHRYWQDNVCLLQEDVMARPERIVYDSKGAWISFHASFRREGKPTKVIGLMVIEFDYCTEQIARLSEVFRTSETVHAPQDDLFE